MAPAVGLAVEDAALHADDPALTASSGIYTTSDLRPTGRRRITTLLQNRQGGPLMRRFHLGDVRQGCRRPPRGSWRAAVCLLAASQSRREWPSASAGAVSSHSLACTRRRHAPADDRRSRPHGLDPPELQLIEDDQRGRAAHGDRWRPLRLDLGAIWKNDVVVLYRRRRRRWASGFISVRWPSSAQLHPSGTSRAWSDLAAAPRGRRPRCDEGHRN